jgi:hypothetical protein
MTQLAAIEPVWTRFAIPVFGLAVLAVSAASGKRRPPAAVLAALALTLGAWLFGVGLLWSKRWPSMIRGWPQSSPTWSGNPHAWQWTGLLVLAFLAVFAAGIALRLFSEGSERGGWLFTAAGLGAFARWSLAVRYSVLLAVILGAVALGALWVGRAVSPVTVPQSIKTGIPRSLAIVTLAALALLGVALLLVSQIPTGG